jgi:hypothetical protein
LAIKAAMVVKPVMKLQLLTLMMAAKDLHEESRAERE